ncbi:phage tail tape measure protein [Bacillus amyloliquefaciens]|uniref:phage tail tape measure protein n=1 Tax=Bacillus amyloliquefaciens TaxID=1390 RepID=UPI0022B04B4B|nr:phage tail tape measure protein [Bacillus amyloliquefaciens]MCZ4246347.1 phage tail tape measure protein [Bacillus amyloliquefaciens]
MAYAADHGSAKFTELGYSMNYVGDYAKSVGYSMEDMAAYLEVMSRRGVEGTSAGTGLCVELWQALLSRQNRQPVQWQILG